MPVPDFQSLMLPVLRALAADTPPPRRGGGSCLHRRFATKSRPRTGTPPV